MPYISLSQSKRLLILLLITVASSLMGQSQYKDETHDFGMRAGSGMLYSINNKAYPLVDISTDYYFLSGDIRMVFGVSFVYPNNDNDLFDVAGLQYLGIEYNVPFLRNMAHIGVKSVKSYLKNKSPKIKDNRSIAAYIGYKHPLKTHLDLYIQLGAIKQPFRILSQDISINDYNLLLRTGIEYYF